MSSDGQGILITWWMRRRMEETTRHPLPPATSVEFCFVMARFLFRCFFCKVVELWYIILKMTYVLPPTTINITYQFWQYMLHVSIILTTLRHLKT